MRRSSIIALAVTVPVALFACRGDFDPGDEGIMVELGISPTPPTMEPTRLLVTVTDSTGAPLDGARVLVEGTMTHAGMVPVLDTARAQAPGQYVVPGFRFTMAGDWIMTVTATLPDGRVARTRTVTDVVGRPGGGGMEMGADSGSMPSHEGGL